MSNSKRGFTCNGHEFDSETECKVYFYLNFLGINANCASYNSIKQKKHSVYVNMYTKTNNQNGFIDNVIYDANGIKTCAIEVKGDDKNKKFDDCYDDLCAYNEQEDVDTYLMLAPISVYDSPTTCVAIERNMNDRIFLKTRNSFKELKLDNVFKNDVNCKEISQQINSIVFYSKLSGININFMKLIFEMIYKDARLYLTLDRYKNEFRTFDNLFDAKNKCYFLKSAILIDENGETKMGMIKYYVFDKKLFFVDEDTLLKQEINIKSIKNKIFVNENDMKINRLFCDLFTDEIKCSLKTKDIGTYRKLCQKHIDDFNEELYNKNDDILDNYFIETTILDVMQSMKGT